MSILLSNDDGIYAPGLKTAREYLSSIDEIIVVAPDKERSASSHSITLEAPLRLTKFTDNTFAASGTPVDCVKLALKQVLKDHKIDIVVVGINPGANTSAAIFYSGTVSAAREATLNGFPAIAISMASYNPKHFETAGKFLKILVPKVLEHGLPANIMLNVNVPDVPFDQVKGVKIVPQGKVFYDDYFLTRKDPRGSDYYWMTGDIKLDYCEEQCDHMTVENGFISISPLCVDLTSYETMDTIKSWNLNNMNGLDK